MHSPSSGAVIYLTSVPMLITAIYFLLREEFLFFLSFFSACISVPPNSRRLRLLFYKPETSDLSLLPPIQYPNFPKKRPDDGAKSRIDRARFVLPAPSLIHSGLPIERIKCRVSDVVEKNACASRPRDSHLLRFFHRAALRRSPDKPTRAGTQFCLHSRSRD